MRLRDGQIMAENLRACLAPYCQRIEIAGGIRRGKEEPHDIELVAIPNLEKPRIQFGARIPAEAYGNQLFLKLWELENEQLIKKLKGKDKYRKYQVDPEKWGCLPSVNYEALDLFIVTPETWGYQYTIRTGPAEFSHWLVTPKAKGGAMPDGIFEKEAKLYNDDGVIPTLEESDFLSALGLSWIDPQDRQPMWGKSQ